jgi:hypothetical protein
VSIVVPYAPAGTTDMLGRRMTPDELAGYIQRDRALGQCDQGLGRFHPLQMCVDTVGPDNVLYGSDYPHNIGDITGCLGRVNSLAEGVRQAVRGRNAQRIFNIT